jgi:hypothetical protein
MLETLLNVRDLSSLRLLTSAVTHLEVGMSPDLGNDTAYGAENGHQKK